MIDIIEQELTELSDKLLNVLLLDRTTRKNICWATDNYVSYGDGYFPHEPILKGFITGVNSGIVKPRVLRAKEEKNKRTKEKAEVFTPSWVCNEQNNLIDDEWFGRKNVFNVVDGHSWKAVKGTVTFPQNKTWKQYVDAPRLEISCGEAPYLVSRYDTVTGDEITLQERIGLLDRKLRIVNENTNDENEWFFWAKRAFESTYGYEYQGDNLLIARENLLYTFIENAEYKFSKKPSEEQLNTIARIISWNIWQMDGIKMTVPFSEKEEQERQYSISQISEQSSLSDSQAIPCKIFDWRSKNSFEFRSMLSGGAK